VVDEFILVGIESEITRFPVADWKRRLADAPEQISRRLDFKSDDHHRVRNFVVKELPRVGGPITLQHISDALSLSPGWTAKILDDLETRLFFLVRNEDGAVSWAFPVTADETPHRLVFNTGERLYAA
jgi:hypothetical protein